MGKTQTAYRLGGWLVEPSLNRVSKNDVTRQLEPLTMDVLEYLLERAGNVVGTEELLNRIWAGSHAVPHMVAKRISQIRRALGDDAKNPEYISTVAKRGYRTLRPVDRIDSPSEDTSLGQRTDDLIRSIAVLPLENLSGDPAQQYLADGMTEELITELAKLRRLRVTSRRSVMRYKSDRPSLEDVAKDLGVDTLIEGSVAREAGRFRVTIQLVDARTDSHLWAHSFDRDVSTVLTLRSDVAREVAAHLNLELSSDEEVGLTMSRNVDDAAYDAYLRGLSHVGPTEHFANWGPSAIAELERAVAIDSDFAEAWAQLALIETITAVWIRRDQFVVVREHAEKALSIDRNLAVAHTALGYVRLLNDWEPLGAESAFQRALQLSPNDPRVLQGYLNNLRVQERIADALQVSQRLVASSPNDFHQRAERIRVLYGVRLFDRVIEEADTVRIMEPEFRAPDEAAAYHRLGRFEDSHRARIAAYHQCGVPCDPARVAAERGWEEGGYEGSLRALVEQRVQENERGPYWFHAQLGDLDAALEQIERLVETRAPWLVGIRYHPDFDALRLDPRFEALLERMKLPTLAEDPTRMADVGRLMAFRGRAPEAIERLNRALTASPEDPRLPRWLESLAWAQFAAADYGQATEWAERVLEHYVSRHAAALAHLLRAASYAHLDRLDAARAALLEAQESWPTTLQVDRDLRPFFLGGDQDLADRYVAGLRVAGLET